MNDNDKLVNAILKDAGRNISAKDLCDALRDAKAKRWRSKVWNRVVSEEQERLDALMREANMAKANAAGRVANA